MAASFNLVSAPMSSPSTPKSMGDSFYPSNLGSTTALVSAQQTFATGYHSPLYFTSPTPRHSKAETTFSGQASSPLSLWSIYNALQPAVKSMHHSSPPMTSYHRTTSSNTAHSTMLSGKPHLHRCQATVPSTSTASKHLGQLPGSPRSSRSESHSDSSPHKSSPSSPTRPKTGGSRSIRSSEIFLDRKAFISLEKSINWQSLLDGSIEANSSGVTFTDTNGLSATNDGTNGENSHMAPSGEKSDANGTSKQASSTLEFTLPGMRDVPAWLKLLRLHKYAPLFTHMSYEEMLRLSEEDLASRHITKGARQKLYLSIQKLKARAAVLRASERELLTEDLRHYRTSLPHPLLSQVLFQVRAFLSTPIRPASLSSPSSPNSPPTGNASQFFAVDFNNNTSGSSQPHQCIANSNLLEARYLSQCWSALATDQLPDIITRLIGHDNLERVNIIAKDDAKTIEGLNEFSDKEDNEDDEESSLEDEILSRSKDKDKDSGLEDCSVEGDESAMLFEQEQELHSMMKTILDKCLSHEAFLVHQPLLLHWREQSLYLFASLRCVRAESLTSSSSPTSLESKASFERYAYLSQDAFNRHTSLNHPPLNYRNCRSPALSKRKLGTFQSPKSGGQMATGHQASSWTHHSTRRHGKMPDERMTTRVLLPDRRNQGVSSWPIDSDVKSHTASHQSLHQPVLACTNLSVIQNLSNISHPMSPTNGSEVENLPEHNLRNMLLQQFLAATQQQQQGLCTTPENVHTQLVSEAQSPPRLSRPTHSNSQTAKFEGYSTDPLQFSFLDGLPSFVEQMPSKWSVHNRSNNSHSEQSVNWSEAHLLLDEERLVAQSGLSDKPESGDNGNRAWVHEVGDGGIGLDSVTLDDIEQLSIRIAEHALDISDDPIYF